MDRLVFMFRKISSFDFRSQVVDLYHLMNRRPIYYGRRTGRSVTCPIREDGSFNPADHNLKRRVDLERCEACVRFSGLFDLWDGRQGVKCLVDIRLDDYFGINRNA